MLGEEFDDVGGDVRWIVDPIDGTKSYVRGVPVWATLLALEVEGAIDVRGRLGACARAALVGDARRRCVCDGKRLAVSTVASLEDATVSTHLGAPPAGRLGGARRTRVGAPRLGDFWQHCLVAEGAIELAVENGEESGTTRPSRSSSRKQAAGARPSTASLAAPGTVLVTTNGLLHHEAVALLGD